MEVFCKKNKNVSDPTVRFNSCQKNYIAVNVVLSVDYTKFFHVIQKGIYTNVR